MRSYAHIFVLLGFIVLGCESSEKLDEPVFLFEESTGATNNWVTDEKELQDVITLDESIKQEENNWNKKNQELGLQGEQFEFKVFSLDNFSSIKESLSNLNTRFIIPIPVDTGFLDFEFEEFVGFSSENSRFFTGKSLSFSEVEASIFVGSNKLDISINSPSDDLTFRGVSESEVFNDRYNFVVTSKKAAIARKTRFEAEVELKKLRAKKATRNVKQNSFLEHKRLRVAVAATGEYVSFHGQEDAFNEIESVIAMTSRILYRELGLRVKLVSDTSLIFDDPQADPFTNDNLDVLLAENQVLMDSIIGNDNYDIGHVFSTSKMGGKAVIASAGITDQKAMGATGGDSPYGDPFIVDYVTHEIGHQLGANHTFTSASCGIKARHDRTSTEPGSGSSIMSYAGLCSSDNLQLNSDRHFHTVSYDEIISHLSSIKLESYSSSNSAPIVTIDQGPFTIPINTPFVLSATGTDNEGDIVYYAWDQIDVDLKPVDLGDQTRYSPLFRSYPISRDSFRVFPALPMLLNQFSYRGEVLPSMARELNFSCVVRDLRGGINYQDIKLVVTDMAGPFQVTVPNSFVSFSKNSKNVIEWNPSNTNQSPIDCDSVDLFLTIDQGRNLNFLGRHRNSGMAEVFIGDYETTKARVWIQASDNLFFDISDNDFEIK